MMYRTLLPISVLTLSLACVQPAAAHFLWVVLDPNGKTVNAYFAESAEPDDPALLDRFQNLQGWALPSGRGEAQKLSFAKGDGALQAELKGGSPTIAVQQQYGVISRGGETFLLNYYAKTHSSPLPGAWKGIESAEKLPLEILPEFSGNKAVSLRVMWKGKPAAAATVVVSGPNVDLEGTADENGVYRCELAAAGSYAIRARHVENREGELDGKKYASVRHYSTLVLPFIPSKIATQTSAFPELPKPTTSFGGAIAGDALYVYGGNYGDAHEYSNEGQSGDLWKLDLKAPAKWEHVMAGPKLQGLAMVEHKNALYRVGGFTAMNKADADQDLKSQPEFARFNADKKTWQSLAALPEPRSSHDAAVLGDHLYVIGGWALRGAGEEPKWHESALRADLSKNEIQWTPIASPPFKRRAVAVAAWNGKIYSIGGMQEKGGTTTAVAVYDPASDSWSEGPAILGTGMDGFGASAFALNGTLYVTTMSGSVQALSGDGKQWQYVGQLTHPRFFHRLLPWQNNQLVAVGGAHMAVGKIEPIELIEVK